ncbi:MAG: helix-turn-helix domain-containing protein [Gammaproteobacteria bacterium]
MTAQRVGAAETRPLDILGISEVEEQAYSWLLVHSGATISEVAHALGLTLGKTQRLIDAVEAKGLMTHSPERPRRYISVSPDIAVEALILQHQNDLQRARSTAHALQEKVAAARPHDEREQIVELITSRAAERQIYQQFDHMAQSEVLAMVRLPMRISRLDVPPEQDHLSQRQALARKVHYRTLIAPEFVDLPGAVEWIRSDIRAGEEARMGYRLPFKMVLVDRSVALVPLILDRLDSPSLLLRSSALLDALYALFEMLWERAAPISFTDAGVLETEEVDSRLAERVENLLSLMAAGLNDKKIAHELGISGSTLKRRVSDAMKTFNARTRFQLGRLTADLVSNNKKNGK